MAKLIKQLRDFPSVEELLQASRLKSPISELPRPVAANIVKECVAEAKSDFKQKPAQLTLEDLLAAIETVLAGEKRRQISRVLNGTGILVHTNLGRAPLTDSYFDAIKKAVTGYGNLEFDTSTGKRGSRGGACEHYLALLAGSESATVVNNCAAAIFLTLNSLAKGKKVLISRGELVQIGGGFRIRDILKQTGAKLTEVGSTNITTLDDYEAAIDDKTGLILKVHQSNFVQSGFTGEVPLKELVALGQKYNLAVINDLGSGAFTDTRELLGYQEPTVQQSVRTGADLTLFSGDKMLGGPQAGLIVGRAELIKRIKKNPIFRTMRVDKIVLAMLEHLTRIYLDGTEMEQIKLWQLLGRTESALYQAARKIVSQLGSPEGLSIEATKVFIGGGIQPTHELPSVGLIFSARLKPTKLARRFRGQEPPLLGRIENDRFIIDLKALDQTDLELLPDCIKQALE